MQGIPRVAFRPALNDGVDGKKTFDFFAMTK